MRFLVDFFKGMVVGIGGIAPGLSGSVMLLILGLYEKALKAISTLFKDFKEIVCFLCRLFLDLDVVYLFLVKL